MKLFLWPSISVKNGVLWIPSTKPIFMVTNVMKKLNKILLILFSCMLALSGYLSSKAQDSRVEKEETIYFLIARVSILNNYYSIGKYKNKNHSLKNYEQMLQDHTTSYTQKIESFDSIIKSCNNWATALLFISIIGNTVILLIETIGEKTV